MRFFLPASAFFQNLFGNNHRHARAHERTPRHEAAAALGGGATLDGVRAALKEFGGLAHRVELVGAAGEGADEGATGRRGALGSPSSMAIYTHTGFDLNSIH